MSGDRRVRRKFYPTKAGLGLVLGAGAGIILRAVLGSPEMGLFMVGGAGIGLVIGSTLGWND